MLGLIFSLAAVSPLQTSPLLATEAPRPQTLRVIDLDGDGRADQLMTRADGSLAVALNRGRREFDEVGQRLPAVEVIDNLEPLHAGSKPWDRPAPEERSRIRRKGTFAVYTMAGEAVEATIQNVRVSHYVDTLSWKLLGPDMNEIAKGYSK